MTTTLDDLIRDSDWLEPHVMGNALMRPYDEMPDLIRKLAAEGRVKLGTLVYHGCCDVPVDRLEGDMAKVGSAWSCPECENDDAVPSHYVLIGITPNVAIKTTRTVLLSLLKGHDTSVTMTWVRAMLSADKHEVLPAVVEKLKGEGLITVTLSAGDNVVESIALVKQRPHLVNGRFHSDKCPTCPVGKVPLSTKDKTAQPLLWQYAQIRRVVDADFAADLETALRNDGYVPPERPALISVEEQEAALARLKAAVPNGYNRSPTDLLTDLGADIFRELESAAAEGARRSSVSMLPEVGEAVRKLDVMLHGQSPTVAPGLSSVELAILLDKAKAEIGHLRIRLAFAGREAMFGVRPDGSSVSLRGPEGKSAEVAAMLTRAADDLQVIADPSRLVKALRATAKWLGEDMLLPQASAYGDILRERRAQDAKHGGQVHDDTHTPAHWLTFVHDKVMSVVSGLRPKGPLRGVASPPWGPQKPVDWKTPEHEYTILLGYRRRMVQIGALAVAALESLDRQLAEKREVVSERAQALLADEEAVEIAVVWTAGVITMVRGDGADRRDWLRKLRASFFPVAEVAS